MKDYDEPEYEDSSGNSGISQLLKRFPGGGTGLKGLLRTWGIPLAALLVMLVAFFGDQGGVIEIEPGEVAVRYNNTGFAIFGPREQTFTQQGVQLFLPGIHRFEKLERRPQIFIMEGDEKHGVTSDTKLTVRANDGSNFYFEKLEIHYQVIPSMAPEVLRDNGLGSGFKGLPMRTHAREILRDEFGRYSFLEIANPTTYSRATIAARTELNNRLQALGIEVTQVVTPKPRFEERVEHAIEERQQAEQEVAVQEEKRHKLEQEKGRKIQEVEQAKSQEYQGLVATLEGEKQQAINAQIAAKREADKYYIERVAKAEAYRLEKITRAKANEEAYRRQAEALVARIRAVGDQGPDVLNRVIAEKVFPQLNRVKGSPFVPPSTAMDIRYLPRAGQ